MRAFRVIAFIFVAVVASRAQDPLAGTEAVLMAAQHHEQNPSMPPLMLAQLDRKLSRRTRRFDLQYGNYRLHRPACPRPGRWMIRCSCIAAGVYRCASPGI